MSLSDTQIQLNTPVLRVGIVYLVYIDLIPFEHPRSHTDQGLKRKETASSFSFIFSPFFPPTTSISQAHESDHNFLCPV